MESVDCRIVSHCVTTFCIQVLRCSAMPSIRRLICLLETSRTSRVSSHDFSLTCAVHYLDPVVLHFNLLILSTTSFKTPFPLLQLLGIALGGEIFQLLTYPLLRLPAL